MTSLTLAQILKEEKVPDVISQQLCSQLTINSFACICASPDDLQEALKDALDDCCIRSGDTCGSCMQ